MSDILSAAENSLVCAAVAALPLLLMLLLSRARARPGPGASATQESSDEPGELWSGYETTRYPRRVSDADRRRLRDAADREQARSDRDRDLPARLDAGASDREQEAKYLRPFAAYMHRGGRR